MNNTFDPYYHWLGIHPQEQPASYYRLLGLQLYENSQKVIEQAVFARQTSIQQYIATEYAGPEYATAAQELLEEIQQAHVTLLTPDEKQAYDQWLYQESNAPIAPQSSQQIPSPQPMMAAPIPVGVSSDIEAEDEIPNFGSTSVSESSLEIPNFASGIGIANSTETPESISEENFQFGESSHGSNTSYSNTSSSTSSYSNQASFDKEAAQEKALLQKIIIIAGAVVGCLAIFFLLFMGGGGKTSNSSNYQADSSSYSGNNSSYKKQSSSSGKKYNASKKKSGSQRTSSHQYSSNRKHSSGNSSLGRDKGIYKAPLLKTKSLVDDPSSLPKWIPQENPNQPKPESKNAINRKPTSQEALNRLKANPPALADLVDKKEETRLEVPTADAISSFQEEIKSKYEEKLSSAKDAKAKLKIADEIYQEGKQATDPIKQYALYQESVEAYGSAGQIAKAWQVLEEVNKKYQTDLLIQKEKTVELAAPNARNKSEHKMVSEVWVRLLNEALAKNRYQDGVRFAEAASRAANKSEHELHEDRVTSGLGEVRQLASAYAAVEPFKQRLETNPADLEALGEWGRFLCLYKNEWQGGLLLWSNKKDSVYQSIIQEDIQQPTDTTARIALADHWWDAAQAQTEALPKKFIGARATLWYTAAMKDSSPEEQERIKQRLKEYIQQHSPIPYGKSINLLSMVDLSRHILRGKWTQSGQQISPTKEDSQARVMIPVQWQGDYELTLQIRPSSKEGKDKSINIMLPVADRHCMLIIPLEGDASPVLDQVDGKTKELNSSGKAIPLSDKLWHKLDITVTTENDQAKIVIKLAERYTFTWSGSLSLLKLNKSWSMKQQGIIGLGAEKAIVLYRMVRLKLLTGSANVL